MNASPKIVERDVSSFCSGIVAFGFSNVESGIEERVRRKFAYKLAKARIFQRFLIHHRIHRMVKRKMKEFSPYSLYFTR